MFAVYLSERTGVVLKDDTGQNICRTVSCFTFSALSHGYQSILGLSSTSPALTHTDLSTVWDMHRRGVTSR